MKTIHTISSQITLLKSVTFRIKGGEKLKREQPYLQVMPNVGLGEGYGQISHAGLAL